MLWKKLKYRGDVLFDWAHSWLQSLAMTPHAHDSTGHAPLQTQHYKTFSQRRGNQAGDWHHRAQPTLPRSTLPSWCWTEVGISRESLVCYRLQSHDGEVQEGSLTDWMFGAFLECNKDVNLSFRTLINLSAWLFTRNSFTQVSLKSQSHFQTWVAT